MKTNKQYLFSVGEDDEERLSIQNRLCDPYTIRFLQIHLPNLVGKTILDVGCGTGSISCLLAKKTGVTGRVIGIDISKEQLDIARKTAVDEKLNNIDFLQIDGNELNTIKEQFDLVYCRFFLMHILLQDNVIKGMFEHVKPGGYFFCEEVLSYESFYSDPNSNAFEAWKNLILEQPKISSTDYFIGKRLNSIFHCLNLNDIKSEICQPVIQEERDKGYFYLGFTDQTKQRFIDAKIITREKLNKIILNLKKEILHKSWTGSAVQYIQILGRR